MTQTPEIPAPPQKQPRRWRRRLTTALICLLVLVVVARVLVNLLLPTVLRKVAAAYDLDCEYERSELNLLSGDAGLWHLVLTPKSGGDPVLSVGYARGNLSVLALLRGQLDVWRVEADGVQLLVERTADGRIPLIEKILATRLPGSDSSAAAVATAGPRRINLSPPLKLDAFRLSQVRARIIDRSVSPAVDTTVALNLRVSDVHSRVRPTTFELEVWNQPALDLLRIEGAGHAEGKDLEARMQLALYGFHPRELSNYLTPLGLKPIAHHISAAAKANLKLTSAATGEALAGTLVFEGLRAVADGDEAAALDKLQLDAASLDFTAASLSALLLDGIRLAAARGENGALQCAGFELVTPTQSLGGWGSGAPTTAPAGAGYAWSLHRATVRNLSAAFADSAVTPAAAVAFQLDEFVATQITSDPRRGQPIEISARLNAPGLIKSVSLVGQMRPTPEKQALALRVQAGGIKPEVLEPYLKAIGIESSLQDGSFEAELTGELGTGADGKPVASAQLTRIRFADGSELFALSDVKIAGIGWDSTGLLRIDSIDIAGPSLQARREASGEFSVLGLRTTFSTTPPAPKSLRVAPPSTAPSRIPVAEIPRLQIGKLTWRDFKLHFQDLAHASAQTLALTDAGVEITDLLIDTRSAAAGKPGTLRAWVVAPGLAERVDVEGTITPGGRDIQATFDVSAKGITASALAPYLAAWNIEPALSGAALQLSADVRIADTSGGLSASLGVRDARYSDGDVELLGVDELTLAGIEVKPDEVVLGEVKLERPRARAERDAQGRLSAGGLRLLAASATSPLSDDRPKHFPTTAPTLAMPIAARIGSLRLANASFAWSDAAQVTPIATTLQASAEVDGFVLGKSAPPATFKVITSIDGAIGQALMAGSLMTGPDQQALEVDVTVNGMSAGPLAAYLPEGVVPTLRDGRLKAILSAQLADLPDGKGRSARLEIRGAQLTQSVEAAPLLTMESLVAAAPRIDPAGGVFAVDEISLKGLATDVRLHDDYSVEAVGLRVSAPPAKSDAPSERESTRPATSTTLPNEDVAAIVAQARRAFPLLTLEKLDLNVQKLSIRNDAIKDSAPLVLSELRLTNNKPIAIGGSEAASRPPAELLVSARLDPIVRSIAVSSSIAALAEQPSVKIDLILSGIQGDGLTALLPQLKSVVDGAAMTDGRFQTHLELSGKFSRRGPADFDFTRPFDLDLQIKGTEFRAEPQGPILAGVEQVHAEAIRVTPATGAVSLKTLEITKPIGQLWRDKDGLHALGWTVKLPTMEQPLPEPAPLELATPAQADGSTATTAPAELRIDKLLISGVDLRVEDRVFDPPVVIPLNGLDVEVRNLSNLALSEPERPIRFSALVSSGKTPLPSIRSGPGELEERELFSQVAASGQLTLYPQPSGWLKSSVSGFEVSSLRGVAHAVEITLGKGVFDSRTDIRIKSGAIDARTRSVITDLQISEPPNGPIQRTLGLPATLDVVVKALQDPDGSITVPMSIPIREGQISGAAIAGAAIGAFGSIVTTAVASAPIKVAGGVGGLLGMPEGAAPARQEPVELAFGPAITSLSSADRQSLDRLVAQMRKDKNVELTLRHELGGGDVSRARQRANPSAQDCANLAYRLRATKLQLLSERAALAGRTRALVASGSTADSARAVQQLRELDRRLAQTEDAMDQLYELMRPGAERQSERRTRAASLEISSDRLNEVKSYLLASGVPNAAERVRSAAPTFTAAEGDAGGKVIVTVIARKRS